MRAALASKYHFERAEKSCIKAVKGSLTELVPHALDAGLEMKP